MGMGRKPCTDLVKAWLALVKVSVSRHCGSQLSPHTQVAERLVPPVCGHLSNTNVAVLGAVSVLWATNLDTPVLHSTCRAI
jgi:hypothetical protein